MRRAWYAAACALPAAAALLAMKTAPKAGGESKEGGEAMAQASLVTTQVVKGKVLPVEATVHRLPTGLTVVLVPYDSPGLAAYYTAMRVGSRDEVEAGHSGFAHLFEHMMFRGTKAMPGGVYDDAVTAMGADSSAWTWNDQTVYFFVAPRDRLGKVIEMEAERFRNLSYGEQEFKTESGAVLGEYNKNFSDPVNKLEEVLWDTAFRKHTYKHTTMGFLADIKAMPGMYGYSLQFFERHYVPGKAIVFVVGDFDAAQVMAEVQKSYGGWTKPAWDTPAPVEPEQARELRAHVDWKNPVLPMLLMGWKVPAYSTAGRESAALALVAEMVFGETGPLYKKLVLDEQTAEKVDYWDWQQRDPGLFIVEARLKDEGFDRVVKLADEELAKIAAGGFDAGRLEAARSHALYSRLLGLETAKAAAQQLAFFATLDGDPMSFDAFLQRVGEVTAADAAAVAGKYLVPARRTVATLAAAGGGAGKKGKEGKGK